MDNTMNNQSITFEDVTLDVLTTRRSSATKPAAKAPAPRATTRTTAKPAATRTTAKPRSTPAKPETRVANVPREDARTGRLVFSSIFATNVLTMISQTDATVDLRSLTRSMLRGLSGDELKSSLGARYNHIPTEVVDEADPARKIKETARRLVAALRKGYDVTVIENAVRGDRSIGVLVAAEIIAIDPNLRSRLYRNVGYTTRDGVLKEYQFKGFVTEADASAAMRYLLARARNPLGWTRRIPDVGIESI